MSDPIVIIDSSEIREGKLEELKTAINDLVDFVEANEPRPIAYIVYLDEAGVRMTVVQVHPDSGSMELHMKVAAPLSAGSWSSSTCQRWMSTASRVMTCSSKCERRSSFWATRT
jgi:hypothetical protein